MTPHREDRKARQARTARRLARFDARYFRERGVRFLAGIDEAGRGALAGPVMASAVLVEAPIRCRELNDSKQLTPARREEALERIRSDALAVAVGWASPEEIDRLNILQATFLASRRALAALPRQPDLLLTDALKLPDVSCEIEPIVKGDAQSQVIAAASVAAKVTRDRIMATLDDDYPEYGFASHKGYGGRRHLEAISEHGPSTAHRLSFRGVCWFDREPRPSLRLQSLLRELKDGRIDAAESREVWLRLGVNLPDKEEAAYRRTVRDLLRRRGESNGLLEAYAAPFDFARGERL